MNQETHAPLAPSIYDFYSPLLYIRSMLSKQLIENYFIAEKQESLLFMIMGIVAILAGAGLIIFGKTTFLRGAAVPLIIVGIIHFAVGFNVYRKSDKQRTEMVYAFDMDPSKLTREETPRMSQVMKSFVVLRYTEITLFLAGIVLIFMFRYNPLQLFWYGFGIALSGEALISLVLDFFAEKRGQDYFDALSLFTK